MARADEPQGARRLILDIGLASGQPWSEVERLTASQAAYIVKRLNRG
jgi:hypothetical protein